MHGRETVLVRGEWECQLFAVVSKGRVRHCLCDGDEEVKSQGEVIVIGLLQSKSVWAQAAASL